MPIRLRMDAARACLAFECKRMGTHKSVERAGDNFVDFLTRISELRDAGVHDLPDDEKPADEDGGV